MIKKLVSLCICLFLSLININAQQIISEQKQQLSSRLATSLTDEQVIEYIESATAAGKSQKQILAELASKGVSRSQLERIKKLKEKELAANKNTSAAEKNRQRTISTEQEELVEGDMDIMTADLYKPTEQTAEEAAKLVFGRNIFNNKNLTFAPSQNLATPANYKLGPGDEVIIDIWGANQNTVRQIISPDGYINIENKGLIYLNGMTVQEADSYLRKELNQIYSGINNETSEIKLTLGQIRTIQINIMGEVALPGTYALSSFSTVFHALYNAGGVNELGSLRNIKLMRNNKEVANIDIYDFILKGKTANDLRLQEGDVIIVPPYELLVNIQGNVKRPMFYEMKNGETVKTLIEYAGNFTGNAYTKNIRMTRQNGREYQIYTIDDLDYSVFKLMDGDVLSVSAMLDRYENKLEIKGAVYRPGIYQYSGQLNTVKQLVEKAEGVMGDAFLTRAVLHREREDLTKEVIQVDLKNILNGSKPDIALQRNDELYIPSIHDLQDMGSISIFGEVARPGEFPFAENTTLEDLIIQAGGLKESASTVRVDISRRIKDNKSTTMTEQIGEMHHFALKDGFVIDGEPGFVLKPYDQVFVRRSPGYQPQINIQVEGEVLYNGTYALTTKNERLTNLIQKAGGVTPYAYVKGAKLMRKANEEELRRMKDVLKIMQREMGAQTDSLKLELDSLYSVGIDLQTALAKPGSDADIVLREGDKLIVPEMSNTVKINGAVMLPNTVTYKKGENLSYYIGQAGGYANGARKNKAFIIYMNGQVAEASKWNSRQIEPGCEIVVPTKDKTKADKWNIQTILGVASSIGSLGLTAASLANILK